MTVKTIMLQRILIIIHILFLQQISILEWFRKDCVTLKKNSALPSQE